jgi:hypothetical protein
MKIRIFLDENTPLEELPKADFPIVPRLGEVIHLSSGNEYTVTEVMWNASDQDTAHPILTVSIKHLETDPE